LEAAEEMRGQSKVRKETGEDHFAGEKLKKEGQRAEA